MDAIQEEFGVGVNMGEEGLEGYSVVSARPTDWIHSRGYSYDSTYSASSLTEVDPRDTSPSQPQSSSSSWSSGPKRPSRSLRCQVSLDVLPTPSSPSRHSVRSAKSSTTTPSVTRSPAVRRQIRHLSQEDHPWTYHSPTPDRRQAIYHNDDDFPRTSEEDEPARTPRMVADETLRSAPGVIGLGEGWAGGPQTRAGRRWWKRREEVVDDDPLELWTRHVALDERKKSEGEVTGLKGIWNRSVLAFGESMPHLPLARRKEQQRGRQGSRGGGDLEQAYAKSARGGMVRSLSNLFSRSSTTLAPVSASTPHLVSGSALPSSSSAQFARSTTTLTQTSDETGYLDLMPTPRLPAASGPRPPWRPAQQRLPNTNKRPAQRDSSSDSARSENQPETPRASTQHRSFQWQSVVDLRRTSTFGIGDPDEEIIARNGDIATQWPRNAPSSRDDGIVGLDTLAQWGEEPKAKTVKVQRSKSIFEKIKVALSPSRPSRSASLSSATRGIRGVSRKSSLSRQGKSTPSPPLVESQRQLSPFRSTPHLVPLKDDSSAFSPSTIYHPPNARLSRRLSGGEAWMRRLSTLIEGDEEDPSLRSSTPRRADTPTQGSSRTRRPLSRSSSFFLRVFPVRSSSLRADKAKEGVHAGNILSGSNLVRYSTVDLNLVVDLPEEDGLGLDDIIVDHRRASIIQNSDFHFSFPSPPTTLPSRAPSCSHSRQSSEPVPASASSPSRPDRSEKRGTTSHRRNLSEPMVDGLPQLEPTQSTSDNGSTQFPETPSIPNGHLGLYTRGSRAVGSEALKPQRSLTSFTTVSFYSAREDVEMEMEGEKEEYRTLRQSSLASEASEFDVVEATVHRVEGKTMRADLISLGQVVKVAGAA